MRYGVANSVGRPTQDQASTLLRSAAAAGVSEWDTARAYGDSENVLGAVLKEAWASGVHVITKLSPLAGLLVTDEVGEPDVVALVDGSIASSMAALGANRLETLLLHRADHVSAWHGAVWRRLLDYVKRGDIGTLGVSVQSPGELLEVVRIPEVGHVQLPFNLLDWRWDDALPSLVAERKNRALVVHVRSAFLQGLLAQNQSELWAKIGVRDADAVVAGLCGLEDHFGRDVRDLALAFVRAQDWCDGVVVGMETMSQLAANLDLFSRSVLDADGLCFVAANRPMIPAPYLDPAKWRIMNE